MTAPFGSPGSISPETLAALPDAMKREGILLLCEMGMEADRVEHFTGLGWSEITAILEDTPPFIHESQRQQAGGGE